MRRILTVVAVTLMVASCGEVTRAAGCGPRPFKPFVPFGCKDLVARCVCNADATRCEWEWVCVK